jgi:cell division septation protein DedD
MAPAAPPAPLQPIVAAAATGWRLQLGSMRSPDAVAPEWARLEKAQADILGSLDMASVRADLGERGVFYRIEAGPIADQQTAKRLCAELRERKVGCILVRP